MRDVAATYTDLQLAQRRRGEPDADGTDAVEFGELTAGLPADPVPGADVEAHRPVRQSDGGVAVELRGDKDLLLEVLAVGRPGHEDEVVGHLGTVGPKVDDVRPQTDASHEGRGPLVEEYVEVVRSREVSGLCGPRGLEREVGVDPLGLEEAIGHPHGGLPVVAGLVLVEERVDLHGTSGDADVEQEVLRQPCRVVRVIVDKFHLVLLRLGWSPQAQHDEGRQDDDQKRGAHFMPPYGCALWVAPPPCGGHRDRPDSPPHQKLV